MMEFGEVRNLDELGADPVCDDHRCVECAAERAGTDGRDSPVGDALGDALRLSDAIFGQGRVELSLQPVLEIPSRLPVPNQEQTIWHMAILRNHALRMAQQSGLRAGGISG